MAGKNGQGYAEGRLRSVYTQVTDGRRLAQEMAFISSAPIARDECKSHVVLYD